MKNHSKQPTYTAGNHHAATIILADPERHLAWPAPPSDAEMEASLMVRWARRIEAAEEEKQSS